MSQIEIPKTVTHVVIGPDSDEIATTKVVAFIILIPGEDTGGSTGRQGHVYGRQTVRLRR